MTKKELYKLQVYGALCEPSIFEVKRKEADYEDFVDKYDHYPEGAEEYCCGDMSCDIKNPTQEVLDRYDITLDEYQEIAEKLSDELSFGRCGWCS